MAEAQKKEQKAAEQAKSNSGESAKEDQTAAAALAKQRQAPRLTMVIEGGIIGPEIAPGRLPISTNEMRAAFRATMLPAITDAFLTALEGELT